MAKFTEVLDVFHEWRKLKDFQPQDHIQLGSSDLTVLEVKTIDEDMYSLYCIDNDGPQRIAGNGDRRYVALRRGYLVETDKIIDRSYRPGK